MLHYSVYLRAMNSGIAQLQGAYLIPRHYATNKHNIKMAPLSCQM